MAIEKLGDPSPISLRDRHPRADLAQPSPAHAAANQMMIAAQEIMCPNAAWA
jgi:hypothetical protein